MESGMALLRCSFPSAVSPTATSGVKLTPCPCDGAFACVAWEMLHGSCDDTLGPMKWEDCAISSTVDSQALPEARMRRRKAVLDPDRALTGLRRLISADSKRSMDKGELTLRGQPLDMGILRSSSITSRAASVASTCAVPSWVSRFRQGQSPFEEYLILISGLLLVA